MWEYEAEEKRQYMHDWFVRHREQHRLKMAAYRAANPERNAEQNRKDVANFKRRHPERAREQNRASQARIRLKQKLLKQAERAAIAQKEREQNNE